MRNKFINIILIVELLLIFLSVNVYAQKKNQLDNKYRLAQTYERAGNFEKAKEIYLNLFEKQPDNINYFNSLNKVYLSLKKYNLSISLINERLRQKPNDISLYAMLGTTYYEAEEREKAFDIWNKALEIDPSNAIAFRIIANTIIENREFDKAIEVLEKGKQTVKNSNLFSYDLAQLYTVKTDYVNATKEFCEIIRRQPFQFENIKNRIAKYFTNKSAQKLTLQVVKEYYDKTKKPEYLQLLSSLYRLKGDYDTAFGFTLKLDKVTSRNGAVIFNFAQAALRNNRTNIASRAFKYIIDNYSGSSFFPNAKIGFARSLEAALNKKYVNKESSWKKYSMPNFSGRDDYLEVLDSYKDIARLYTATQAYNEALYRMGLIYFNKFNNVVKAESLFTIVYAKSPFTNFGIQSGMKLGELSIYTGNLDKAKQYFTRIEKNNRAKPEIKNNAGYKLAKIEFWKGNFTGASKKLDKIIDNLKDENTNDALELKLLISTLKSDSVNLAEFARGDLLIEQKKFSQAADVFKKLAANERIQFFKDYALIKRAETLNTLGYYPLTVAELTLAIKEDRFSLYSDKFLFLLGNTYFYGLGNKGKAMETFQKLLEKFPNSLYFDKARETINLITINESKNL